MLAQQLGRVGAWDFALRALGMSTPATTKQCNRFTLNFYVEDASGNDKLRIPSIYLCALLF